MVYKMTGSAVLDGRVRGGKWTRRLLALLYVFILVENPLTRVFPFLSYFDEVFFIVVAFWALLKCRKGVSRDWLRLSVIVSTLCLVMGSIGLAGWVASGLQESIVAAFKDMIAFAKFPIGLTALVLLLDNVDEIVLKDCAKISRVFILLSLFCAIINLIYPVDFFSHDLRHGVQSFTFFYSHPTYLVFSIVLCFSLISREHERLGLYELACFAILILTMRDKAFGFIALAVFFSIVGIEKRNNLLLYLTVAAVGAMVVAWPKISLYISYPNSPREAMYSAALDLSIKFFPLGAGFASIASSVSGEYYSQAYFDYGIDKIPDMTPDNFSAMGDAGYAYYLGVFGLIGLLLFFVVLYLLYRYLVSEQPLGSRGRYSILILFGYILLALTVETTLTNPSGMELAFVLALLGCCVPGSPGNVDRKDGIEFV